MQQLLFLVYQALKYKARRAAEDDVAEDGYFAFPAFLAHALLQYLLLASNVV